MDSVAQQVLRALASRTPPMRRVAGVDKTLAINGGDPLLAKLETAGRGLSEDDGPLITAIMMSFLGRGIWATDETGLVRLFEAACQTARYPNYLINNVVMNVGFGGSDGGVPLRALAYVLPAIETLASLQRVDGAIGLPRVRLFTGQNLAIACLNKGEDVLWPNTMTLFVLVKLFTRRFYPGLEKYLIFDFDRPLSWGDLMETLLKLKRALQQRADSDVVTAEAMKILQRMASGHGEDSLHTSIESALLYGSAHAPAFGDFGHAGSRFTRFLDESGSAQALMVGCGTQAEMKFFAVRRAVTAQAPRVLEDVVPNPWSMLFTWLGEDKPGYYRHSQGDLNWAGALEWHRLWDRLPSSVRRELQFLADCAGGVNKLLEWVSDVRQNFAEVEGIGAYAEELLTHALLGSSRVHQAVRNAGYDPLDTDGVIIWIIDLPVEQRQEIVRFARDGWMGI